MMQQTYTYLPQKLVAILTAMIVALGSMMIMSIAIAPSAAANDNGCNTRLLGMPTWYDGLVNTRADSQGNTCSIMSPRDYETGMSGFVWRIALNVIEALLIIIGYASVIMIITGGFLYMVAAGESGKIVSAKKTIFNAVIGLVVALSAVAIVNLVKGMF